MAFNALNSAAPMNMPDFEDASPAHFRPDGTSEREAVGVFAALQNAKDIFEGRWTDRAYEVTKKNQRRTYTINRPPDQWPTRFARPPGIHVRFDQITVAGEPVPGVIAVAVLWALNNYEPLARAGTGVYFYIPKTQTRHEGWRTEPRRADWRDGGGHDLSGVGSVRPLEIQSARVARDGHRQAARTPARIDLRPRAAAGWRSTPDPRRHPDEPREGSTVRRLSA